MTGRIPNTSDSVLMKDFYNKSLHINDSVCIVSSSSREILHALFSWLTFREIHSGHELSILSPERQNNCTVKEVSIGWGSGWRKEPEGKC